MSDTTMGNQATKPRIVLSRRNRRVIPDINEDGRVVTVQTRRVRRISSIKLSEFIVFIEDSKRDLPDHFEILVDYGKQSFQHNGETICGEVYRIRASNVSINEWVGGRGELWIAQSMPAAAWHKVIRNVVIKH